MTFDGPVEWNRGWISSNSDVPVSKRKQQGRDSLIIWDGIVDQTIIGPFKVDERIKLKRAKFCNFIDMIFFT